MSFIFTEPKKINIRRIGKSKSYEALEVLKRLEDFLNDNSDKPARILRGFWKDQQDAISYEELREAVKAGYLDEKTFREWRQDYARLVNDKFSHTWKNALALGHTGQPSLDKLTDFHLDMQRPGVLNWIGSRAADFVTVESQTTKDAIRSLLMRGVTQKHTVDEMSRVIRPLIGLNKPQTIANYNYYNNIVKTLTEQHPKMSVESVQRKAQEAAVKYAERQHRERAWMIARTELSFAYNRGAYEGIKQAQELGLMGAVVKIWSTSQGGNVCPECEALEGEEVGMDETFFESRGLFRGDDLLPPLHPRCECAVQYREMEKPNALGRVDDLYFDSEYTEQQSNWADRFFTGANFKTGDSDLNGYVEGKREIAIRTKVDVTEQWLKEHKHVWGRVIKSDNITVNGIKYYVDGHNVVMNPSEREIEVANIFKNVYGMHIIIRPKVNKPEGIKSADFSIDNELYDLKSLKGSGKNTLYNIVYENIKQADNFILDLDKSLLRGESIEIQIKKIFSSDHTLSVNKIIIFYDNKIKKVYRRGK